MAAARLPGVIALFDVDGTLTAPRKVRTPCQPATSEYSELPSLATPHSQSEEQPAKGSLFWQAS